jgi:hypothetical protein
LPGGKVEFVPHASVAPVPSLQNQFAGSFEWKKNVTDRSPKLSPSEDTVGGATSSKTACTFQSCALNAPALIVQEVPDVVSQPSQRRKLHWPPLRGDAVSVIDTPEKDGSFETTCCAHPVVTRSSRFEIVQEYPPGVAVTVPAPRTVRFARTVAAFATSASTPLVATSARTAARRANDLRILETPLA